jgi:hypothetical protein
MKIRRKLHFNTEMTFDHLTLIILHMNSLTIAFVLLYGRPTISYKKFRFIRIFIRVQYIVDPLNQILGRVRLCRTLTGSTPLISTKTAYMSTGPYKELVKQVEIASLKIFWNCRYRMRVLLPIAHNRHHYNKPDICSVILFFNDECIANNAPCD